jgi:hypothetical protein
VYAWMKARYWPCSLVNDADMSGSAAPGAASLPAGLAT